MALYCGLNWVKPLQILGFSGFLFPFSKIPDQINKTLICHGEEDPMIGWKHAKLSYSRLEGNKNIKFILDQGTGHELGDNGIKELVNYLK